MADIVGGAAAANLSGSFSANGSTYSYNGSLELTADKFTSIGIIYGTSYVSDFCGNTTSDGRSGGGCAQFLNGAWVVN